MDPNRCGSTVGQLSCSGFFFVDLMRFSYLLMSSSLLKQEYFLYFFCSSHVCLGREFPVKVEQREKE